MAKQLVLVRHGKSDWSTNGMTDFERPLNHRGNKNAPEMAERISKRNLIPELLVSSPAKRALTTAKHFSDTWDMPKDKIQKEPAIYEANTTALLQVVNRFDNQHNRIALFGHNPGLTDFVNFLADAHIYTIPTAGVVYIDFPFDDWSMVSHHTGSLLLFDYPKNTALI
ncbi:SixA phosphatase family protein [Pedobacter cryoconitis]|uniref:Phosphohistidine phosphatase n=1 Tax=Pedobacter cryoconitis TaxID=188932 RepID=A0A7X0IZ77_9SPHI|nr:histidine phosphatase family protein [Pedobacter cryoconitis]MBB6498164.1 phosphohistidine phosphatase [Pedobacter cryoconitis]